MIDRKLVEKLALEGLEEEYFIVDISIRKGNVIEVVVDGDNGVTIQKCIDISRSIEHNIDREKEDFELSVYSAGLGKPFKVHRQYVKNIGKKVEVNVDQKKPVSGILSNVNDEGFDIEVITLERLEKKKKKVEVKTNHHFSFTEQPLVKNIISFK